MHSKIQEKFGVTFQNETRDGRLVSIKTRIPPSKFWLIYEAIVKEKKNVSVGYYRFNLTILSSLLSYDIFSFHPLIHITSYPPFLMFKILFKKSFYLSHICNSHILEVLKCFNTILCMYTCIDTGLQV